MGRRGEEKDEGDGEKRRAINGENSKESVVPGEKWHRERKVVRVGNRHYRPTKLYPFVIQLSS